MAKKRVTVLSGKGGHVAFCDSVRDVLLEIKRASSPPRLLLGRLEHLLRCYGGGKGEAEIRMRQTGYIVLAQFAQTEGKHARARAFLAAANKKSHLPEGTTIAQGGGGVAIPFSPPPPDHAKIGHHIQCAEYRQAKEAVAEVAKADNLHYRQKLELLQYVRDILKSGVLRSQLECAPVPDGKKEDLCLLCNELGQFLSTPVVDDQWKEVTPAETQLVFAICELGYLYGNDKNGRTGYTMAKLCGACGGKAWVTKPVKEVKQYLANAAAKGHTGAMYFTTPRRLRKADLDYRYYQAQESRYKSTNADAHDGVGDQFWRVAQGLKGSDRNADSYLKYIKACCMSLEQLNNAIQKPGATCANRLGKLTKKIRQRLRVFFCRAESVDYHGIGSFCRVAYPDFGAHYNPRNAYQLLVDAARQCHPDALKVFRRDQKYIPPSLTTAVDAWGSGGNCQFKASAGSGRGGYVLNEEFQNRVVEAAYASLDRSPEGLLQFGLILHAACKKAPKKLSKDRILAIVKHTVFLADPELGARLQDVLDSSEWSSLCHRLDSMQRMLCSPGKRVAHVRHLSDFSKTLLVAGGETSGIGQGDIFSMLGATLPVSEGVYAVLEKNGIVSKSELLGKYKFCEAMPFESEGFDVNNLPSIAKALLEEIEKDSGDLPTAAGAVQSTVCVLGAPQALMQSPILGPVPSPPVAGLCQVGNSCYMNSAIQILFSMPSVVALLKDTAEKSQNNGYIPNGLVGASYRTEKEEDVFENLVKVWSVYQSPSVKNKEKALRGFHDMICERYDQDFKKGEEGETPALLSYLLSLLDRKWSGFYGMRAPYIVSRVGIAEEWWQVAEPELRRADNDTCVVHLGLDGDTSTSFERAMNFFLNKEATWCAGQDAKICYLKHLPQEFVVSCAVNGNKRITDIPLEFTLENYLESAQDVEGYFKNFPDDVARVMDDNKGIAAGKMVELTAFSVFHGNARLVSQGGHYTTCRKHKGQWYEINDSVVTGPLLPFAVAQKLQKATNLACVVRG